jgi:hypothetical protein
VPFFFGFIIAVLDALLQTFIHVLGASLSLSLTEICHSAHLPGQLEEGGAVHPNHW